MNEQSMLEVIAELRLLALHWDLLEEYWTLVELEKFILAEPTVYH